MQKARLFRSERSAETGDDVRDAELKQCDQI
jgi:hypothetical protein